VVVGSLNMDLIGRTAHIPMPGETVLGKRFSTAAGGKGANQAIAAARLGVQVTMVGCIGEDDHGRQLLAGLKAESVNTRFVRMVPDVNTGVALITVDDAGENTIVVISGANWELTQEDVAMAESTLATSDMLVLQLESPLEVVESAIEVASRHHVPVMLNPAPAQPLPPSLLSKVCYLIPNEVETALLVGCSVNDVEEAKTAARRLQKMGVDNVIITMGGQGAYLYTLRESCLIPAFPVKPVDTTAAGDAFVAGMAVAIAEKRPLIEAVRFATAVGALATTKHGAQPSLPTATAVQQFLDSFPNEA